MKNLIILLSLLVTSTSVSAVTYIDVYEALLDDVEMTLENKSRIDPKKLMRVTDEAEELMCNRTMCAITDDEAIMSIIDTYTDQEGLYCKNLLVVVTTYHEKKEARIDSTLLAERNKLSKRVHEITELGWGIPKKFTVRLDSLESAILSRPNLLARERERISNIDGYHVTEDFDGLLMKIQLSNPDIGMTASIALQSDDPEKQHLVRISRNYGQKRTKVDKNGNIITYYHDGIDQYHHWWTRVNAILSGVVVLKKKSSRGYGWEYHILSKDKKMKLQYAHLSKMLVNKGDFVTSGQMIAREGNTGHYITNHPDSEHPGTHLHISAWVQDASGKWHQFNPKYLYADTKNQIMADHVYFVMKNGRYIATSKNYYEKTYEKLAARQTSEISMK